jgi:hypothetical protein
MDDPMTGVGRVKNSVTKPSNMIGANKGLISKPTNKPLIG